jgi:hypothetical protein
VPSRIGTFIGPPPEVGSAERQTIEPSALTAAGFMTASSTIRTTPTVPLEGRAVGHRDPHADAYRASA